MTQERDLRIRKYLAVDKFQYSQARLLAKFWGLGDNSVMQQSQVLHQGYGFDHERLGLRDFALIECRRQRLKAWRFDALDKLTKVATICLGCLLLWPRFERYQLLAGVGIVAVNLLALVCGFERQKQMHQANIELCMQLVERIDAQAGDQITTEILARWWQTLHHIQLGAVHLRQGMQAL